jgi:hypothetical protein
MPGELSIMTFFAYAIIYYFTMITSATPEYVALPPEVNTYLRASYLCLFSPSFIIYQID